MGRFSVTSQGSRRAKVVGGGRRTGMSGGRPCGPYIRSGLLILLRHGFLSFVVQLVPRRRSSPTIYGTALMARPISERESKQSHPAFERT